MIRIRDLWIGAGFIVAGVVVQTQPGAPSDAAIKGYGGVTRDAEMRSPCDSRFVASIPNEHASNSSSSSSSSSYVTTDQSTDKKAKRDKPIDCK